MVHAVFSEVELEKRPVIGEWLWGVEINYGDNDVSLPTTCSSIWF
jgi:hypothetical protein